MLRSAMDGNGSTGRGRGNPIMPSRLPVASPNIRRSTTTTASALPIPIATGTTAGSTATGALTSATRSPKPITSKSSSTSSLSTSSSSTSTSSLRGSGRATNATAATTMRGGITTSRVKASSSTSSLNSNSNARSRASVTTTSARTSVNRRPLPRAGFGRGLPDDADDGMNNSQSILKMIKQARTSGRLNLSNKNLREIPNSLFDRSDVTSGIDVSLDRESTEQFAWWDEVDLSKLIIADNAIESIDLRVCDLFALTLLDAHNNKLETLPDLSPLQSLNILQLSSNNITELPRSLFNIPLGELHLSSNNIQEIPEEIGGMKDLLVLDMSGNKLQSLPSSIGNLRTLTTLNISSNQITMLPSFRGTTSLTRLDVSHNKLKTLGDFSGCVKLQDLSASENSLTSLFVSSTPAIDATMSLPALVRLDCRVNRLSSIQGNIQVSTPSLQDLLLQSNLLKSFEGSGIVESAKRSLQTLDIRDNSFETIPSFVLELQELKRLFVEGNPIRVPRRAIIEKGTAAILLYMREMQPVKNQDL
ncbi:Leucine-rich repeat-containing protein 40 [Blyttiomyces sp. JEL0837]|nr:Leucine-rich repeat-containing protein 40 [Blyttiomyces sp. JEL0837]